MTEMRFYIPGTTTRKEAEGGEAGSGDEEEKNAVTLFYDTLIEKAEIGETAGDTIATFLDVLHLTPRFVPFALKDAYPQISNNPAEAGSTSTCTTPRSVSGARRTTTRSSTRLSRSLWSSRSPTTPTLCSALGWIRLSARARLGIRSWSCSSSRTKRSRWISISPKRSSKANTRTSCSPTTNNPCTRLSRTSSRGWPTRRSQPPQRTLQRGCLPVLW